MLSNCSAVNGGWNEWVFGPCSKSCGGGLQNITRECNRPKPECNGKDCDGPNYYAFPIKCNNFFCPGKVTNIIERIAMLLNSFIFSNCNLHKHSLAS